MFAHWYILTLPFKVDKKLRTPFDHIASSYDSAFTETAIGKLQRKQVWTYLESITSQLKGLEILELNCGTGEDAILFGDKGFNIVATDVSEEMLKVTTEKINQNSLQHKISPLYLDLNSFEGTVLNKRFDLVFSNFGGMNCLDPKTLGNLLSRLPSVLLPGGRVVAVIMAKHCLWETFYFLMKLHFKEAFRRWTTRDVIANLDGASSKTWYYTPREIKTWSAHQFDVISIIPIGFLVPPSYLENFFKKKKGLLSVLNRIENKLGHLKFLADFSDHYIIDLKLK